jgi:hypothetical protein
MNHTCTFCGIPVDPSKPGTYREITGWEEVRRQGGANSITLRVETGRYACASCIALKKSGGDPSNQGGLL